MDYCAPLGTPVQALGNGRVIFAGWDGEGGNMIKLRHANGYQTLYLHLSKILVHVGQRVRQGVVEGGRLDGLHEHRADVGRGAAVLADRREDDDRHRSLGSQCGQPLGQLDSVLLGHQQIKDRGVEVGGLEALEDVAVHIAPQTRQTFGVAPLLPRRHDRAGL